MPFEHVFATNDAAEDGGWPVSAHRRSCCTLLLGDAGATFSPTGMGFSSFYIAAHVPVSSLYDGDAFAKFWQTPVLSWKGVVPTTV
jgi:hypothetical protein